MASSSTIPFLSSFSSHKFNNLSSVILSTHDPPSTRTTVRTRLVKVVASSSSEPQKQTPTKLVTFLGKGGSGKTTSAIFAAQVYAMAGLNTCLVIQSQDPTAEMLLKCKIGTTPVKCSERLSAVRLETTKMLLEPLTKLKQADARLNLTQGVLEGIVGEELGVLPGMDSIFAALALEKLVGFFGTAAKRNHQVEKFNIVIYDGISTEETLRMIGATSKAKLYLKYLRNMAEKTDIGRLAGPSLMRLVDEGLGLSKHVSFNGTLSSEIWNSLEQALERGSSTLTESLSFGCYLVMDVNSQPSFQSALRYWGCAIQSGTGVCGAFGVNPKDSRWENTEKVKEQISPLPFALLPHFSVDNPPDWNAVVPSSATEDARNMLSIPANQNNTPVSPVKFDTANKAVTLFMPGFDKSEIKLYQYRGGSELLVEAGDQRRVICLPQLIQGKVGGAKFTDRNLIITMR